MINLEKELTDSTIGLIAEHLVCVDLLSMGLIAFMTEQICAYDVVCDVGGKLLRIQVKSTRKCKEIPQRVGIHQSYMWHVRRAGKGGKREYGDDEFDLYALVAIDTKQIAYIPSNGVKNCIQIRPNGVSKLVGDGRGYRKFFSDYPFDKALEDIGVTIAKVETTRFVENIQNNIVTLEGIFDD